MNPEEIGQYLEPFDYEYFLNMALENVPAGVDTREGSIIYDAIAPLCYQSAEIIMQLKNVDLETFTQTATGNNLDLRAAEHGISRIAATPAIAIGSFTAEDGQALRLREGDRFSTTGEDPVYFSIVQDLGGGNFSLICETLGTRGNEYLGQLLPIDHINGLATAILESIEIPARDVETDDELRERVLKTYQLNDFGGNIEDYINFTGQLDGVGAVQVYPIWQGGGTVRVVILNNAYEMPSTTLIANVQEQIDPTGNMRGYGIAPIGHKVTVAAPTRKNVNVSLHIDPLVGYTLDSLKPAIEAALAELFASYRRVWSAHDDLYNYAQTIYRSQAIAELLKVEGVANVSNVRLNSADSDLELVFNNSLQECAFLGTVTYT
ncbi:baseplate J/gp47 family protein [Enterococcus olivae]